MRFRQALPIWPCALHQAMNLTIGLRGVVQILTTPQQASLRLAGRTTYRAWVDGRFLGCGPARAAHGHVRVDEWPLDLAAGIHLVAVEVNATNVPAYAATGEEPFIQAEIVVDGQVVAATGASGWQVVIPGERIQRVSRMSRQRGFVEAWRLSPTSSDWRRQVAAAVLVELAERINPRRLADLPSKGFGLAGLQRLGSLLDHVKWPEKAERGRAVLSRIPLNWVRLESRLPPDGRRNARWRVIENTDVHPDVER